jgi:hypothetical protein
MYIITGPLRFVLINGQILFASFLFSITITPQSGYPWPGFISYDFPELPLLFLGMLLSVAFLRLQVIHPVKGWGTLLSFLLFTIVSSFLLKSILPVPDSAVGILMLLLTGWYILWGFTNPYREKFVLYSLIYAFVLIVLKFIVIKSAVFQTVSGLIGLPLSLLVDIGSKTPSGSVIDQYLVFAGFILYCCAILLQLPQIDYSSYGQGRSLFAPVLGNNDSYSGSELIESGDDPSQGEIEYDEVKAITENHHLR